MHSLFEELEEEILRGRGEYSFGEACGKSVMAFKLGAISREESDILEDLLKERMTQIFYPEG